MEYLLLLVSVLYFSQSVFDFADVKKRERCSKKANHDCRLCDYWDCPYHRCKHEREKRAEDEV